MKKLILFGLLTLLLSPTKAQDATPFYNYNLGLGIGMDYGGFGGRISYLPIKDIAIFGALGYNLVGTGYNVGASWLMLPNARNCPYFSAMYGYNAVIKVIDAEKYDKIYYGSTIAFGLEIKIRRKNFFNVELTIPFRSSSFNHDWDAIKNDPNFVVTTEPLPFGFSMGFHFVL